MPLAAADPVGTGLCLTPSVSLSRENGVMGFLPDVLVGAGNPSGIWDLNRSSESKRVPHGQALLMEHIVLWTLRYSPGSIRLSLGTGGFTEPGEQQT